MATIFVEGKPFEARDGLDLLHACLELGFDVPYFCWHPALKSVGASRSQLLAIFLYEYAIIGFMGGMVGYPLGLGATVLLDSFLLKLGTRVTLDPGLFLLALALGVFCSLTASFLPTYKLAGIKITETFRTQWEV